MPHAFEWGRSLAYYCLHGSTGIHSTAFCRIGSVPIFDPVGSLSDTSHPSAPLSAECVAHGARHSEHTAPSTTRRRDAQRTRAKRRYAATSDTALIHWQILIHLRSLNAESEQNHTCHTPSLVSGGMSRRGHDYSRMVFVAANLTPLRGDTRRRAQWRSTSVARPQASRLTLMVNCSFYKKCWPVLLLL